MLNARNTDPFTSHEAERALSVGSNLHRVLSMFQRANLTAEQVGRITGIPGYWKRISDLTRMGMLTDTGETRVASTGRKQRVMAITERGIEVLQQSGE